MTEFFFQFNKPYFWPISPVLGTKNVFSEKSHSHAQLHKGLWHYAKIQGNLMIQFQENTQTDVRREGWKDPNS